MDYPKTFKYEDLGQIVEGWREHKPTNSKARKRNLDLLENQYEFYIESGSRNSKTYVITKKKFTGVGKKREVIEEPKKTKIHRTYKEMVHTGDTIEDINYLVELTEDDYMIHDFILSSFGEKCYYNYEQIIERMSLCPLDMNINWNKMYHYSTNSYQKQLAYVFRSLDLKECTFTTDDTKIIVYKVDRKREEPLQMIDKRLKLTNFKKRQLDIGILMATIREETDSMRVVKTMTKGGVVVYIKATDLFEDVGLVNDSFKHNREYASYLEDYLPKEEQSLIYSHIQLSARNSVESALRRLKRGGAISTHIYTYIMVTTDRQYIGLNNEQAVLIDKALELTVQDIATEYPQVADRCIRGASFYNDFDDMNIEKFKWEKLREHIKEHFPNYKSHMRAFGIGLVDTKVERYLKKRAKEENMDLTDFIEQQHGFTHLESTEIMTRKYHGESVHAQKRKKLVESCTQEEEMEIIMGYPIKEMRRIGRLIEDCRRALMSYTVTEEEKKRLHDLILTYQAEYDELLNKYGKGEYLLDKLDKQKLKEIDDFLIEK